MHKFRLQVQYVSGKNALYSGPFNCGKQLFQSGGIRGLYVGMFPTMLHRGNNWAYFGAYEYVKKVLNPDGTKLSPLASIAAGASAGFCFWITIYPVDVIKVML